MTVFDLVGRALPLDSPLFEGGEGWIYQHPVDSRLLLKVYKSASVERGNKVAALLKIGTGADERLHKMTAWPQQAIFNKKGGDCVGFIMRKVIGEPIHSFYSPKDRKAKYPEFTWMSLIHVAKNAAAAFHYIHAIGAVMGDVNESNFLVDPKTGLASLIDCDSYQVTTEGKTYRCQVGVGHWTPPELHGANFNRVDRTINHDLFGLSILIFHLLFIGRHPFASQAEGDLDKAIKNQLFSYSDKLRSTPPKNTLLKQDVTHEAFSLFEQAFLGENVRPSAEQWFLTLAQMENRLVECSDNTLHNHLVRQECPFCRLDRAGVPVFNYKGAGTATITFTVDPVDTQFWTEIKRMPLPEVSPPTPIIRREGRPIPIGITRINPGTVIAWIAVPMAVIIGLSSCGCFGIWIAVILGRLALKMGDQYGEEYSTFAQLMNRRLAAVNKAQQTLYASEERLNTLVLERGDWIDSLKVSSDNYYKRLQEISLIQLQSVGRRAPLDLKERAEIQGKLRQIHENVLRINQETRQEIARLEEDHLRHREAHIRADADFQVVLQAERNGGFLDPQFQTMTLFILVVIGSIIFGVMFAGSGSTAPQINWRPTPTLLGPGISLNPPYTIVSQAFPFPDPTPTPER